MQAFILGADGNFHYQSASRLRDDEQSKVLKRKEKARRAAMARWHRKEFEAEGQKISENSDAQASSKHETNVTSPLTGSPSRALPLLEPLSKSTKSRTREDGQGQPDLPLGPRGWRYAIHGQHGSVTKAKPPKSPRRAFGKGREDREAHRGGASVSIRPKLRQKAGFRGRSDPPKAAGGEDRRFGAFEREVFAMWRQVNPTGPGCTWRASDQESLRNLLREHPDLSIEQFQSCLGNVRASIREGELSPTAAPKCWLGRVVEYLQCPLDRYGKPIRKPVERVRAAPRQL